MKNRKVYSDTYGNLYAVFCPVALDRIASRPTDGRPKCKADNCLCAAGAGLYPANPEKTAAFWGE